MKGKRTEVTAVHKKTGEQIKFSSLTDASKYIKVSKMQLSRIIRGQRQNTTEYFITDQLQG